MWDAMWTDYPNRDICPFGSSGLDIWVKAHRNEAGLIGLFLSELVAFNCGNFAPTDLNQLGINVIRNWNSNRMKFQTRTHWTSGKMIDVKCGGIWTPLLDKSYYVGD